MGKRILSMLMALCMVVSAVPATAYAAGAGEVWDGTTKTEPQKVEDTSAPPTSSGEYGWIYKVSNGAELAWIAEKTNRGELNSDYMVVLTADINLGKHEWTPIGTEANPFCITFSGEKHTVSGLKISGNIANAGLFGVLDRKGESVGYVRHVTVTDGSIVTTGERAGGVVGYAMDGKVIACHNTGVTVSLDSAGATGAAGGIAGEYNDSGYLENCSNSANVNVIAEQGYAGGIAGKYNNGGIVSCANSGDIKLTSVNKSGYVGGIVSNGSPTFINCMNSGTVTETGVTGNNVGGVIGNQAGGSITHSYTLSTEDAPIAVSGNYSGYVTGCGTFPIAGGIVTLINDRGSDGTELSTKTETYATDGVTGVINALNAWIEAVGPMSNDEYFTAEGVPCLPSSPGDITPTPTPPSKIWDGSTKTPVTGVDIGGAAGKRYTVSLASELAWIADEVNSKRLSHETNEIVLSADINLGNEIWTPIGNAADAKFNGRFDGQGHSVKGLRIQQGTTDKAGLFGYISGTGVVENLSVTRPDIVMGGSADELAGGIAAYSDGIIANCHNIDGKIETGGTVAAFGGIVGKNGTGTVRNCSSDALLDADVAEGMGGIVGVNGGKVINCANSGELNLGGIAGSVHGGIAGASSGEIVNCMNSFLNPGMNDAAGVVGKNQTGGIVSYSYTLSTARAPMTVAKSYNSSVIGCGTFAEVGGAITLINDRGSDGAELTTKTETYVTDGTTGAIDAANAWVRSPEGIAAGGKFWTDSGLPTLDADPSTTPPTPDPPSHGGSYYSEEESKAIDSRDFWATVRKLIAEGKKGEVVMADARDYDNMPDSVMEALRSNSNVALEIEHKNGKITIAAGKAAKAEAGRIHYPFALLTELYSGTQTPTATGKLNPDTGR